MCILYLFIVCFLIQHQDTIFFYCSIKELLLTLFYNLLGKSLCDLLSLD